MLCLLIARWLGCARYQNADLLANSNMACSNMACDGELLVMMQYCHDAIFGL